MYPDVCRAVAALAQILFHLFFNRALFGPLFTETFPIGYRLVAGCLRAIVTIRESSCFEFGE